MENKIMESKELIMMIIYSLAILMIVITMIGLLIDMTILFKEYIKIIA